jgi:hypothetical protein
MNIVLKKEIIKHIFHIFGLLKTQDIRPGMIANLIGNEFLINKKVAFEIDGKKYENNIWAATAELDKSIIKIMIADICSDVPEYIALIQMNTFPPCAVRISFDIDDFGSIYFGMENNNWVDASTLLQVKILIGIEELSGLPLEWKRFDNYMDMYKILIGFLNFYDQ